MSRFSRYCFFLPSPRSLNPCRHATRFIIIVTTSHTDRCKQSWTRWRVHRFTVRSAATPRLRRLLRIPVRMRADIPAMFATSLSSGSKLQRGGTEPPVLRQDFLTGTIAGNVERASGVPRTTAAVANSPSAAFCLCSPLREREGSRNNAHRPTKGAQGSVVSAA